MTGNDRRIIPPPVHAICVAIHEDHYTDIMGGQHISYDDWIWEYKKYPHALLVGGTGSGKTTALKLILEQFRQAESGMELYLCTFKHKDEDFPNYKEDSHFASYFRCREVFENFYQRFLARLSGTESRDTFLLLAFDEWAGFILSLEKKAQDDVLAKMGQILMMGRSMHVQIVLAIQRPDAVFFRHGARDNFGMILAMGNMSSDGFKMIFPSEFIQLVTPCSQIGDGHILIGDCDFGKIRILLPPCNR